MRPGDEILPLTRVVSLIVVAVLIPAFVVLWCLPGRTADLWAWTIKPEMTAIFMGSAYGAGAYFFGRVLLGRRWHPGSAGVLSAAAFAALMLVTTLIYWDRFNHGYGWIGVYIASPVIVGAMWLRNHREDPRRRETRGGRVSLPARRVAGAVGAGAIVAAAVFLLSPSTAIDLWPWTLTPLTARVIGGFTAQVGLGALLLSVEERWSGWRLLLQTVLLATVLMLVGVARAWSDFDQSNAMTWIFVAGLVGLGGAILALYASMDEGGGTRRP